VITARQVFNPSPLTPRSQARTLAARACREVRPGACLRLLLSYYRDPLAWYGAFLSLLVLAYAGGAVMFMLHAEILGELGPAIDPMEHWALDSTLGFVGLAPVVAVIVPLAAWAVRHPEDSTVPTLPCAIVGGTLFGLALAPAPIAHDLLVGRGTWLANHVTQLLGGTPAQHIHGTGDSVPQSLSIALQVLVGIPTYILLLWAALRLVQASLRHREALRQAGVVLSEADS
jgi:hypothetical protein